MKGSSPKLRIWQRILPVQIQPDRRLEGQRSFESLPKAHTSRLLIINSCNLVVLHSKSTFWTIVHSSSHSFSPLRLQIAGTSISSLFTYCIICVFSGLFALFLSSSGRTRSNAILIVVF